MSQVGQRCCAFCGAGGSMTREHLWPAALHRQVAEASQSSRALFRVARFEDLLKSEPTLRDVCAGCNNGPLSQLDSYICSLYERQLSKLLERYERVELSFDYHLLKRWIVKMNYNSARINGALDSFIFEPLLPYIMGRDIAVGKSVQLYLQLTYPGPIPESFREGNADIPKVYYPEINRVGHAMIRRPTGEHRTLRAVHLRSYTFFLAFFDPKDGSRARNELPAEMEETFGATLLRPNRPTVQLVCDGYDAWQSFAPSLKFRFRNKHDGPEEN